VDDVLRQGIAGISDLITTHGKIMNADFADVRTVMQNAGTALIGIGSASGENRAELAAKAAINSPLLDMTIDGARGVLFNITGGADLGMFEIDEAAKVITKNVDSDATVKFGTVLDETMGDEVRITVIATGFDENNRRPTPISFSPVEDREFTPKAAPAPSVNPIFEDEEEPEVAVRRPLFKPKPVEPVQSMSDDNNTDDELDIPAFIRKKMK